MDSSVAYIFAIVLVVLVINVFIIRAQFRRGNSQVRKRRSDRAVLGEEEQAIWRDKEVARRIEREQDGAYERLKLKNETLALFDEVRRRHANDGETVHIEQDEFLHEADDREERVTMIPFEDDFDK